MYKLLIILLLCRQVISQDIRKNYSIFIDEIQTDQQIDKSYVYQNLNLNQSYNFYDQQKYSCLFPSVFRDNQTELYRTFYIQNDEQYSISLDSIVINSRENLLKRVIITQPRVIQPGGSTNIRFNYDCDPDMMRDASDKKQSSWDVIKADITINGQTISFSYVKVCNLQQKNPMDYSLLLCIMIGFVLAIYSVRLPKIRQMQFRPFETNYQFIFIFSFVTSLIAIQIVFFSQGSCQIILTVLISILSLLSTIFIVRELTHQYYIQYIRFIILTFSCLIICLWYFTQSWILSDILSLAICATTMKLIQIKSLRQGTIFLVIICMLEVFWVLVLRDMHNYNILNQSLDYPIKLQCRTFNYQLDKRCSYIAISDIIFPGLLLSYTNRYDKSKGLKMYTFSGGIGYFIGILIYLISYKLVSQKIPLAFFTFPMMILIILIYSFYRDEHMELWNGIFQDIELLYPIHRNEDQDIEPKVKQLLQDVDQKYLHNNF